MFDTKPESFCLPDEASETARRIVWPTVTPRPATEAEIQDAQAWLLFQEPTHDQIEVAEYADGATTHAPEVVDTYKTLSGELPESFTLVYVHRGVQAQSINPLLPSLLSKAGHNGPAHALRCDGRATFLRDALHYARAVTPKGGAALIIDDRQIRLGPIGSVEPGEVHFHLFFKPGQTRDLAAGAPK